MIFIIDNGESYSDHRTFFVRAHSDFRNWFGLQFLPWCQRSLYHSDYFILAESESLTWRSQDKTMSACEFFDKHDKQWLTENDPLPMLPDSVIADEDKVSNR